MSKLESASAACLIALNGALVLFVSWTQIQLAEEGRRLGLDEHPPVIFLAFLASAVIACGAAYWMRYYKVAMVGGAGLAIPLLFLALIISAGVGL